MDASLLYAELDYVNHSREKRAYYAQLLLSQPELMRVALDILFMVDDERSNRAGWLLEFVTKNNIAMIYPHLDYFTTYMHTVYQDSALRPVAKICESLAISYYKNKNSLTQQFVQAHHKEKIIEAAFDWLITDQKVAVKAYSLTTLYHLGTENDWIHDELLRIMENQYASSSAAFKARTRHVSGWIKKRKAK